ncbi:proton-conducting transporter membrane subunit [Flexivirga caeni]|uniref:NADH dehydrogenase FAD-containing subunit n=1 Tax=Flexivirga caeni TaxID=2294115 RepID=A0A3M9MJK7_9MICO|nr:proton-conducting transporter membrane subunit [Flexivirga caeni]RNI24838.1 NADH dehydrogenase FAD-containing subunit [Flexivirga caeni]
MTGCLIALLLIPLVAGGVAATVRGWAGHAATIAAGLACLGLVAAMWTSVGRGTIAVGFLRVDAVSMVFLLGTSFLYAVVAVYTAGYLRAELARRSSRAGTRYQRRFLLGINLFVWAMLFAPSVNGLALVWVGVEITTIVSAVLVAIDDTEAAAEAAWKYVLIASCGLGIALLATIFMYYAGAQVLGQSYDLSFPQLLAHAGQLPATPVRLAFVLAVIGFGTKVGLFPVHTWLPDAHAEAPTPLSALLSGSLLAVSFYAILRFYQVTAATVGAGFAGGVLLVFGVLTLLLAALYLLDQRNLKRFLAYSSVEHMGILAIGVSFGNPIALFGVMLHVLVHAAGKGGAFLSAGAIVQGFRTKQLAHIHGAFDRMPWTASTFVIAIFALCAMPPFGIFRSEFLVIQGGFSAHHTASAAVLVLLVTVAFVGLAATTTRSIAAGPVEGDPGPRQEANAWMVVPVLACVLVLLLLGLWLPGPMGEVLHNAAFELSVGGGHGPG